MDGTTEFLLEVADAVDIMILEDFIVLEPSARSIVYTDSITGLSMSHELAAIMREVFRRGRFS